MIVIMAGLHKMLGFTTGNQGNKAHDVCHAVIQSTAWLIVIVVWQLFENFITFSFNFLCDSQTRQLLSLQDSWCNENSDIENQHETLTELLYWFFLTTKLICLLKISITLEGSSGVNIVRIWCRRLAVRRLCKTTSGGPWNVAVDPPWGWSIGWGMWGVSRSRSIWKRLLIH